ncbi:MAG: thioesterase family protein [Pirellulaceae bacterium]|jgi:acyl-CoA thioester hydrolase|nr:thioesterase family protein [Pirellulaceae bacterium]MDP7020405.1 thioesterase family protein [Pirellulaceae bacterium]
MTFLKEFTLDVRVRYQETDGQGRVHHANYLTYFEQARVEMLRHAGVLYGELEASGRFLVVADVHIQYYLPARYDDLLQIHTTVTRARGARMTHRYLVYRDAELVAEGETVIACTDHEGWVRRLPSFLQMDR